MIDCVQAVPPGYLKPVVEASIKRSQSLDLGGLGKSSKAVHICRLFRHQATFLGQ